jgi:uncharacterized Zn finger protein
LLLKLRGLESDELMAALSNSTGDKSETAVEAHIPLPRETTEFWQRGASKARLCPDAQLPSVDAALVRQLGPFPLWRGSRSLLEKVSPVYAAASSKALEFFLGRPDRRRKRRSRRRRSS